MYEILFANNIESEAGPCCAVGSASDSRARGPFFNTWSGYIRLFLLLLIQEGQYCCQLLAKVLHEVLVNHLGHLSLPRKSVVRLIDCPDMAIAVYCGRKTTTTTLNLKAYNMLFLCICTSCNRHSDIA